MPSQQRLARGLGVSIFKEQEVLMFYCDVSLHRDRYELYDLEYVGSTPLCVS